MHIFQLADREIAKSNIMLITLKKTYLSKSVPKNWFDSGCIGRCPNPHHRWWHGSDHVHWSRLRQASTRNHYALDRCDRTPGRSVRSEHCCAGTAGVRQRGASRVRKPSPVQSATQSGVLEEPLAESHRVVWVVRHVRRRCAGKIMVHIDLHILGFNKINTFDH